MKMTGSDYESNLLYSSVQGERTSTSQNEREGDLVIEFEEVEPGVSTGDMVFDVEDSPYYRYSSFDGKYFLFFEDEIE